MSLDDRELALLVSISNEIAAMRSDMKTLHAGLVRIGAIIPKKPESMRNAKSWEPPVLRRLGNMITIIAQSSPASAKAMAQLGTDTELDPGTDPEKDPQDFNDNADNTDAADKNDPHFVDKDRRRLWLFNIKKDLTVTKPNRANVNDGTAPDTKDDNNDVSPRPDTLRDFENPS